MESTRKSPEGLTKTGGVKDEYISKPILILYADSIWRGLKYILLSNKMDGTGVRISGIHEDLGAYGYLIRPHKK